MATSAAGGAGATIDAAWLAQQLQNAGGGQALSANLGVGGELNLGGNFGFTLGGAGGGFANASAFQGNALSQFKLGVRCTHTCSRTVRCTVYGTHTLARASVLLVHTYGYIPVHEWLFVIYEIYVIHIQN